MKNLIHTNSFYLILIIFLLNRTILFSQDSVLDKQIFLSNREMLFSELIVLLSDQGVTVSYKGDTVPANALVSFPKKSLSVKDILSILTRQFNVEYKIYNKHIIVKPLIEKDKH